MKTFIIFLLSIVLISCSSNEVTISKDEYRRLKGDTIVPEYPKHIQLDGRTWDVTLASDGHEYIHNGLYDAYSCMHWIECKKCKQDTTKTK